VRQGWIYAGLLLAALSGCGDGQPFTFGTADPTDPDPDAPTGIVPESVAGNLSDANWTPPTAANPDGTLIVEISALDTTPVRAEYTRNPNLDVPGYTAYSQQEDPLDRMFIAMVAQSADGSVTGALVMDGGQFNKYFGGIHFEQNGRYTPHVPEQPNNGLVSYAGSYVGMLNGDAPRPNEALPVDPGTDPALVPGQAIRVEGQVFLNVDFADNMVNGVIYDRTAIDIAAGLPDVVLIPTEVAAAGTFEGTAENPEQEEIGSYAGVFGGVGATSVAGGIYLNGDFIQEINGFVIDNEEEYGLFVLNQCGLSGDAAICDNVNP
jgi:hypothetical protein